MPVRPVRVWAVRRHGLRATDVTAYGIVPFRPTRMARTDNVYELPADLPVPAAWRGRTLIACDITTWCRTHA